MDKGAPIETSHNISYFQLELDSRVFKRWLKHTKVISHKFWHSLHTLCYLSRLERLHYKKSTFMTHACNAIFCSVDSYVISFLLPTVIRC